MIISRQTRASVIGWGGPRILGVLLLGLLATSQQGRAQSGPVVIPENARSASAQTPKIGPARFDFSTGTGLVPPGYTQIESGVSGTRRGASRGNAYGGLLLRVPASERVELRVQLPTYAVMHQDGRSSGADDVALQAVFLLSQREKTSLALQLVSTLPTGSRGIAERRLQPTAILAGALKLSPRSTIVLDVAASRASQNQQRFTQAYLSTRVSYDASKKVTLFAETYAFNKQKAGGNSQRFANAGAIFFLRRNLALDASFGVGLDNHVGGPDYLYTSGLSALF